jgi:RimJ/RimL family protein N-acetyltransferase
MSTSSPFGEPVGPLVTSPPAIHPSIDTTLEGKYVTLPPLLESHGAELYNNAHGPQNAHLYKYLPSEPLTDFESFATYMKYLRGRTFLFPFAIVSKPSPTDAPSDPAGGHAGVVTGVICLLNIVPLHRSVEIGHVLFGPLLQRTTAATEACYLLMKHCFEDLHYLRVEWKANNLNEPSKRAAMRLGFVFEGVFRKHMVVKGRSRDSAWFSVTDEEWVGGVKQALEHWLRDDNFDEERRQKIRLEDIREGIVGNKVEHHPKVV